MALHHGVPCKLNTKDISTTSYLQGVLKTPIGNYKISLEGGDPGGKGRCLAKRTALCEA